MSAPKAYLSTSGGFWRVIVKEQPVTRDLPTEAEAREAVAHFRPAPDLSHGYVWFGDAGEFRKAEGGTT